MPFFQLTHGTDLWTPTYPPIRGSTRAIDRGTVGEKMADGFTKRSYFAHDPSSTWTQKFAVITDTDLANFETFLAATGDERFQMKAPITLGVLKWVYFVEGQDGDVITLTDLYPGHWSATMKFRSAPTP